MKKLIALLLLCTSVILQAQNTNTTTNNMPCCNPYPKTITVNGSAELEVIPDQIYVQIILREYDKSRNNKVTLDIIKPQFMQIYKGTYLPDSILSVGDLDGENRNDYYQNRKRRKRNLDLYQTVAYNVVFSNYQQLEKLADALDDDATQSFSIIKISHTKMTTFRKQVKIDAIKAAKIKAQYLTEAINEKLGDAIRVIEPNENGADNTMIVNRLSNTTNLYQGAINKKENYYDYNNSNNINFTTIKIRFEVEVVFAIR